MKQTLTILIFCFFFSSSFASTISGYIFDKKVKEQLVGATVVLSPGNIKSFSKLNGKYSLNNVQPGTYQLKISYIGYQSVDTTLEIKADENIRLNFYLVSNTADLNTVTIAAKGNRESDKYASRAEQKADNLVNIVSANSITISPDITVANVMARVSGVSIERGNTGDGEYATIRGMDKKYNTTLINGIKIPSPNNKDRYVPLDIFPADLVERIEVYKSLTPSMEGDASGGVINMIMKTAPDEFRLEGNLGIGYSQLFANRSFESYSTSTVKSKSPAEILGTGVYAPISDFPYNNLITSSIKTPINSNFSLTIGDRFLNKKLGVIFSGTYQNTYAGNNTSRLVENATLGPAPGPNAEMTQVFPEFLTRQYSSLTNRLGLISTIDYNFNRDNTISLFGTYLQLNENRVRLTNDLLLGNYSYNGYIGGFQQSFETQTRQDLSNIKSLVLHGNNKLAEFFLADWSVAYSSASQQLPDMAAFTTTRQISPNASGTATSLAYGPLEVQPESREWSHNTDKDLSAYLNLHYVTKIKDHSTFIDFGGMFRHKTRDNYDNTYNLTAVPDQDSTYQKYISIPASKFAFIPASDAYGTAFSNAGVYNFTENVQAGYVQAKYFINDRFDILFGVRAENTSQAYDSSLPVTIAGKSASISYIDILPSLNAKYSLSNNQALRLSYFKSILRPAFSDLVPYRDTRGTSQDDFGTIGNPNLLHTVIDNYDFRYEVFPSGLDQFMIGAFYKSIVDPIEYALVQTDFSATLNLTPYNFGTAHNYGIEAVFRKFFGKIGISGNYTYTHSLINSTKKFNYTDPTDNSFHNIEVNQPRPLQGQAANVGNFSLLYKDSRLKIDAQLAAVYTGERINTLSLYKDLDNWEQPTVNLDFSAQKEFAKNYVFYIKVNNILNTPFKLIVKQSNRAYSGSNKLPIQDSPAYATIENDKYYARFLMGFRFKF
jgi:TonB-dependent receptor